MRGRGDGAGGVSGDPPPAAGVGVVPGTPGGDAFGGGTALAGAGRFKVRDDDVGVVVTFLRGAGAGMAVGLVVLLLAVLAGSGFEFGRELVEQSTNLTQTP